MVYVYKDEDFDGVLPSWLHADEKTEPEKVSAVKRIVAKVITAVLGPWIGGEADPYDPDGTRTQNTNAGDEEPPHLRSMYPTFDEHPNTFQDGRRCGHSSLLV